MADRITKIMIGTGSIEFFVKYHPELLTPEQLKCFTALLKDKK